MVCSAVYEYTALNLRLYACHLPDLPIDKKHNYILLFKRLTVCDCTVDSYDKPMVKIVLAVYKYLSF